MLRWPLTLRGTGALALGVVLCTGAHVVGSSEALAFGVLMIALVAGSLLSVYLRRGPEHVTRSLRPGAVVIGEDSTVTVRLSGRSALPTTGGSWSDDVPAGLSGDATGSFSAVLLPRLGASDILELSYSVTGIRRGLWTLGPLMVVEHDPFGISRRMRRRGSSTTVTVTPRILPLVSLPRVAGDSGLALTTAERRGQGSDNLIPRPYAPGDSMRRIHWRASARLGDFMVREEEHEASPRAVVVLDRSAARWSAEAASPGADEAFESAVTLCVSAAWRLARDGYVVSVIDGEGAPLASLGDRGAVQSDERHALLSAFTTLGTRSADALQGLADVLAGVTAGPLVLIAGRLDTADAPLLARIVPRVSRPLLFAAAPHGGALDEARSSGWRASALGDDAATAWTRSLEPGSRRG